ncbi:Phosphatidylinositol (PI) 3-kinase, partial [Entophlyctis luteolus]
MRATVEPFIICQVFSDGKLILPPVRTSHQSFSTKEWIWNEWLSFPIKYKDLSLSSKIAFTIWDVHSPGRAIPIGGSTFSIFDENKTVKKGKQKLKIWPGVEADGSSNTRTDSSATELDELDRLERLIQKYELGDVPRCDWMDKLAFREIDNLFSDPTASQEMLLYIELPKFDFPLIYHEKEYSLLPNSVSAPKPSANQYFRVYDPEIARGDNPVEIKHRKLTRSHRNGPLDRDLKPNAKLRDDIN